MRNDSILAVLSTVAVVLTSLHFADDVVRRLEPAGQSNLTGIGILAVWLIAILSLLDWRAASYGRIRRAFGYVVILLGSLLASVIPVLHFAGVGMTEIRATPGGFFFIWNLLALGVAGGVSVFLTLGGLWGLRGRESSAT